MHRQLFLNLLKINDELMRACEKNRYTFSLVDDGIYWQFLSSFEDTYPWVVTQQFMEDEGW